MLTIDGERQEYGFAQEMVRQAVLNMVRQRPWFHRLHRALLDAIAASPGAAADAAFLAAGYEKLGAVEQACVWLRRAMEAAAAAGLSGEAAELGDRLVAKTTDPTARTAAELDIVRPEPGPKSRTRGAANRLPRARRRSNAPGRRRARRAARISISGGARVPRTTRAIPAHRRGRALGDVLIAARGPGRRVAGGARHGAASEAVALRGAATRSSSRRCSVVR
jgi:hypothetical protein